MVDPPTHVQFDPACVSTSLVLLPPTIASNAAYLGQNSPLDFGDQGGMGPLTGSVERLLETFLPLLLYKFCSHNKPCIYIPQPDSTTNQ